LSVVEASAAIRDALAGLPAPELLVCRFMPTGASQLAVAPLVSGQVRTAD
jgi:hypothetical protein